MPDIVYTKSQIDAQAAQLGSRLKELTKFRHHHTLGGRFLLDPNEFCGWQADGVYDQTLTADLGNVGAAIARVGGGLCFPVDVKITRMYLWHYQNNAAILPWGFRIARQLKTNNSNTVSYNNIMRECTGVGATAVGPREYGSTRNHLADIDFVAQGFDSTIPAGEVVVFGVEAPTAVTTNRYIMCMSGYLSFEEVLS